MYWYRSENKTTDHIFCPDHLLLTRLLGPDLTSLPRQILTATASLRSLRLQDHRA
jgi:hypothetical protein